MYYCITKGHLNVIILQVIKSFKDQFYHYLLFLFSRIVDEQQILVRLKTRNDRKKVNEKIRKQAKIEEQTCNAACNEKAKNDPHH